MAFNSPSGGRVAVDDISFSPQFCSIDSGELQPQYLTVINRGVNMVNVSKCIIHSENDLGFKIDQQHPEFRSVMAETCTPEPPFDPAIASCDFESGLCHYTLDRVEGSSWRSISVKPNIFRHGDHTTGAGGLFPVIDLELTRLHH